MEVTNTILLFTNQYKKENDEFSNKYNKDDDHNNNKTIEGLVTCYFELLPQQSEGKTFYSLYSLLNKNAYKSGLPYKGYTFRQLQHMIPASDYEIKLQLQKLNAFQKNG